MPFVGFSYNVSKVFQIFSFTGFQILYYNFLKIYEEACDKQNLGHFSLLSPQELYVHFQPI